MSYLSEHPEVTRESLGLEPEDNLRAFDLGVSSGLWHCLARMDGQSTGMTVARGHGILWWEPLETEAESPLLEILAAHDDAVALLAEYGYVFLDVRKDQVTPDGSRISRTRTSKR